MYLMVVIESVNPDLAAIHRKNSAVRVMEYAGEWNLMYKNHLLLHVLLAKSYVDTNKFN